MTLEIALITFVALLVAVCLVLIVNVGQHVSKAIKMIDKNEIYINYANSNIHELELFLHKKLADAPSAEKKPEEAKKHKEYKPLKDCELVKTKDGDYLRLRFEDGTFKQLDLAEVYSSENKYEVIWAMMY